MARSEAPPRARHSNGSPFYGAKYGSLAPGPHFSEKNAVPLPPIRNRGALRRSRGRRKNQNGIWSSSGSGGGGSAAGGALGRGSGRAAGGGEYGALD